MLNEQEAVEIEVLEKVLDNLKAALTVAAARRQVLQQRGHMRLKWRRDKKEHTNDV